MHHAEVVVLRTSQRQPSGNAALNVLPSGAVAFSSDRPLADFVRLVGTAELQAFGVPEGWLG